MISGGLTAAHKALVPEFERATGHKVLTAYGPSMGTTTNAIPGAAGAGRACRRPDHGRLCARRSRQERQGDRRQQGRSVKSPIAVAVKSGTPKPDISTPDALKRALLAVKTIAYSGQRQRRLCLDRDVRQARHRRRNEGQGEEDSGHAPSARSSRAAMPRSAFSR
jgi:hypothetical protein